VTQQRSPDGLFANTLLGIPMLQLWADLRLWEWVLNNFAVRAVVELGTGNGAFSSYLALQCYFRDLRFVTFDQHACVHLARAPMPIQQIVGDMWTADIQA